jgi:hypothetical protein
MFSLFAFSEFSSLFRIVQNNYILIINSNQHNPLILLFLSWMDLAFNPFVYDYNYVESIASRLSGHFQHPAERSGFATSSEGRREKSTASEAGRKLLC